MTTGTRLQALSKNLKASFLKNQNLINFTSKSLLANIFNWKISNDGFLFLNFIFINLWIFSWSIFSKKN